MRRTREWWARLTKYERSELWWLERGDRSSHYSSYYPDDCTECGYCGSPHLGSGLCPLCGAQLDKLLRKADGAGQVTEATAAEWDQGQDRRAYERDDGQVTEFDPDTGGYSTY